MSLNTQIWKDQKEFDYYYNILFGLEEVRLRNYPIPITKDKRTSIAAVFKKNNPVRTKKYNKNKNTKQYFIKNNKIKEGKNNISLHKNIGNNFIKKFGLNVFLDFLNIYKETGNIKQIFNLYGIEFDVNMHNSFSGVIGNANSYGLSVDDIINFVLEYKFKQ